MNTYSVRFIASRCIHCGAALRVAEDATIVCCQYCNSDLQVVRSGPTLTTRLLTQIQGELGHKLDLLRLQNEIGRLDHEWSLQRENYMVHDRSGSRVPSLIGTLFGGLFAVGFGIFWLSIATAIDKSGIFPLFGILFILAVLVQIVIAVSKAGLHGSAQSDYQQRRRVLLQQLAQLENPSPAPKREHLPR